MKTNKLDICLGMLIGMLTLLVGNFVSIDDGIYFAILVMIAFVLICFTIITIIENRKID